MFYDPNKRSGQEGQASKDLHETERALSQVQKDIAELEKKLKDIQVLKRSLEQDESRTKQEHAKIAKEVQQKKTAVSTIQQKQQDADKAGTLTGVKVGDLAMKEQDIERQIAKLQQELVQIQKEKVKYSYESSRGIDESGKLKIKLQGEKSAISQLEKQEKSLAKKQRLDIGTALQDATREEQKYAKELQGKKKELSSLQKDAKTSRAQAIKERNEK